MIIVKSQDQDVRRIEKIESLESEISTQAREFHAYEVDVLSQFKANLNQLEELQSRFKFVLREVSDLLAKK